MEKLSEKFLFATKKKIPARALYLGERIDLRALEKTQVLGQAPLTLQVSDEGCAVILRYGAVVLFNVKPVEELAFIKNLEPYLSKPVAKHEEEELVVEVEEGSTTRVYDDSLVIPEISLAHVQLIGELLARSVVLDYYEERVADNFQAIEPLALSLKEKGHRASKGRELLKHIGEVLINQFNMVGRVEVREKPDMLWYHPELERLYSYLEDELEIRERHRALERKLKLITETAETVLDLLQAKRSLRVEWYIVILIVVEILLTLYQMFFEL